MTVDAVIVGSGPGGATVADVLTAAGWTVTIVEKGRNHLLDPDDLTRPAFDYSNDEIKFLSRHFLGPDPLIEPRTFRTREDDGDRTHVGEVNSVPDHGGGRRDPRRRQGAPVPARRLPAPLASSAPSRTPTWPTGPSTTTSSSPTTPRWSGPSGVAGTDGANPFAAPRSGPFPMPSGAPMFGATRSAAAAERLGYHPYPAPDGGQQRPLRRPAGLQQLRLLRLLRLPHPRQGRSRGHAASGPWPPAGPSCWPRRSCPGSAPRGAGPPGSTWSGPTGSTRFLAARHVVVAAGAIETPRLLLLSGFDHPLIGPLPDDPLPDHRGRVACPSAPTPSGAGR